MTNDPKEPTTTDDPAADDTVVEPTEISEEGQDHTDAAQAGNEGIEEAESPENELEKWRNLAHRNQAELENFRNSTG